MSEPACIFHMLGKPEFEVITLPPGEKHAGGPTLHCKATCWKCGQTWEAGVVLNGMSPDNEAAREQTAEMVEDAAFPKRVPFVLHPADAKYLFSAVNLTALNGVPCCGVCGTIFIESGNGYTARLTRHGCPICATGEPIARVP